MLEAIKNSASNLSDVIALVSEAGKLTYPNGIVYSIMVNVHDAITLSEWLDIRDKLFYYCEDLVGKSLTDNKLLHGILQILICMF